MLCLCLYKREFTPIECTSYLYAREEALSGKSFLQIKYLTDGRDNSTIYLVILYIFTVNHESDIDAYFMKKGIAYEDELQQIMEVTD